MDTKPIK